MAAEISVYSSLEFTDVQFLGQAAMRTLAMTISAIGFGTSVGVPLGFAWSCTGRRVGTILSTILDVFRSVPLIIQLVLFDSFISIAGHPLSAFQSGSIVLSAYTGALIAFLTKAGIDSVHRQTRQAARSLGMTSIQEFLYVAAPIGLRAVLPSWIGIAIALLKDSSLVSVLGYVELIRASQMLSTRTQEPFLILIVIGAIFFAISYPISRCGAKLERRWKYD